MFALNQGIPYIYSVIQSAVVNLALCMQFTRSSELRVIASTTAKCNGIKIPHVGRLNVLLALPFLPT